MKTRAHSEEEREVLVAARRYRRNGYKVSKADQVSAKPSFLGNLTPDLIAERDDDKVVIEVKRSATLPGSNDLVELAERVAGQPGWRFELIALPTISQIALPDLTWGGEEVQRLLDKGFTKAAFLVVAAMIDNVVSYASVRVNRNPANFGFPALVRELVAMGVIDEEVRQRLSETQAKRRNIMQIGAEFFPERSDVEAALELGQRLQQEVVRAEAEGE